MQDMSLEIARLDANFSENTKMLFVSYVFI